MTYEAHDMSVNVSYYVYHLSEPSHFYINEDKRVYSKTYVKVHLDLINKYVSNQSYHIDIYAHSPLLEGLP